MKIEMNMNPAGPDLQPTPPSPRIPGGRGGDAYMYIQNWTLALRVFLCFSKN